MMNFLLIAMQGSCQRWPVLHFRKRFVEEARKNTSLPQRECEVTSLAGW
jgi:hypothetical protein